MSAFAGFRDGWLNADVQQAEQALGDFDAYSQYPARQLRYDLFWGFYQNNTFRELAHRWAPAVKASFSLYRHTRNVYNPCHRLVEFHVAHLMGGTLDRKAGDGQAVKSALPIESENQAVPRALAPLWNHSRWQVHKSTWTRFGACQGDAPLAIRDDPDKGRVTLEVIHPGHLKWVEKDHYDLVTSYIREEWRYDPRHLRVRDINPILDPRSLIRVVRFNEEVFVDSASGEVVHRTYLDGALFDWRIGPDGRPMGNTAAAMPEWRVPYDFVPLVIVPHQEIGLPWGMAEPHALISKTFEVDDMASGLGDQIRKAIRAPKLLAGVEDPNGPLARGGRAPVSLEGRKDQGTSEMGIIYGPVDARAYDLTFPLDIVGVNEHIKGINAEIERDYPELQMDIWATGDTSGRALRVARQRTENKIQERRVGYDAGLVQAHKFALAIGARRGYRGYEGLDFDPREEGTPLDHAIGHRPVFSPDPLDDIEEGQAFWTMANAAVQAGMPLQTFLRREGWDEADIAEVATQKRANQAAAMEAIRAKQRLAMADTDAGDDETT